MEHLSCIGLERQRCVDHGDFEAFYLANKDAAFKLAMTIVSCSDAANDATQEAFVRLLNNWHRVRHFESPIGFLLKTTTRCCIDILRRRRKTRQESREDIVPPLSEDDLDVRRALARLSPSHQALLALSIGQGWSYDEIAEVLGIPPGTVASRLNAARIAFKKHWGGER